MNAIVDIVLPVFCLIGLGYAVARLGYLSAATGDGMADFVVKVAVPILLIRSLATAEFGDVNPGYFLLVYFSGIAVAWAGASLLTSAIFKRGMRASIIAGVSAGFSNLVLMGIPLVERAYGKPGLQIFFFLIAIHLPVMMAVSTFLMEVAVRADGVENSTLNPLAVARKLLRSFAVNPIIIGIFIGLAWRLSGLGIGGLPGDVMDLLARTTGPLALFSLGMGLIKYGIKGNVGPALCIALLSLIALPATVYFMGTVVFPLPELWLKVALLAAACPTGINAYLIASYFKIAEGLATNTIVLALLGSIITVPFWLSVV